MALSSYLLNWYENGDRLDVAVVANRLVACGCEVRRCGTSAQDSSAGKAEAGDYLVRISPALADALTAYGLRLSPIGEAEAPVSLPVAPVRALVLSGRASAYPYYGYYALTLARLGLAYRPVSGEDVARGALDGENLFILPGGFSNWSLDAKEETSGADDAVRGFFRQGGAAVASCGGAFYLAKGRPTWLGLADARPHVTIDYLRTGVGMTTCRLAEGWMRLGLPPTLEIPYFHGPAFDEIGPNCEPLAHFRDLRATGRLFIDNPLTPETFAADMQGRIAALKTEGPRGRAILFSPHPEMGELLAKYMALESYIPHYLPIRGETVMRETLDAYRPAESRSFLMVLNAVEDMARGARTATMEVGPVERATAGSAAGNLQVWIDAWGTRTLQLQPSPGALGELERYVLAGLEARLPAAGAALLALLPRLAGSGHDGPRLAAAFATLASDAAAAWAAPVQRRPAELLLELELALLLIESWRRLCEIHDLIETHA